MLELKEFKTLSTKDQLEILRTQGRYMHYRIKGWCKIDLYYFHNYYVEVWYLNHMGTIGLIRVLNGKPNLDPYLDTIKLKVINESDL
ncbi:hypothetical protein [Adhaeribacter aquaticus]|uniref:hypothetical protein n=1 Tax=Adhaeribacter aquaticus TaxID=299567 RepID=UPI00040BB65A|nr:hypothetical protein [Adhaeribacter aquaticus]